jgi:hypothetical protein
MSKRCFLAALCVALSGACGEGIASPRAPTILRAFGAYGIAPHHQSGYGEGLGLAYGFGGPVMLLVGYSHQRFTGDQNVRESSVSSATLSLLFRNPNPGLLSPWLSIGLGNDHLTEKGSYWSFFIPTPIEGSFVGNHPAMELAGGVAIRATSRSTVDVGAAYNQSFCACTVLDASNITESSSLSLRAGLSQSVGSVIATGARTEQYMLIRARGGALYWNQQGDGPGWSAGGSMAFPVGNDVLLGIGLDHMVPDDHANVPQRTMDPMTVQVEFGAPFRRRITPTLQVGSGIYILRQTELVMDGSGQFHWTHGPHTNHLGFNAGGGVSVTASSCLAVDLVARYHQSGLSVDPAFRATTVTVSLTYLLPGVRTRRA